MVVVILKEMVLDKENDKVHPRYLAYDIIKFQVSLFFHESDLLVLFIPLVTERHRESLIL